MYTDEDLDQAVAKGIFSATAVEQFRAHILQRNNTHFADEEDFRLITSFNDIFVLIACALLLLSAGSVLKGVSPVLAGVVVAILSWVLAEFFVRKRKMALPAIALLIAFVASVFASVILFFGGPSQNVLMLAGAVSSAAAWLHWQRFRVPVTVAVGAESVVLFAIVLLVSIFPVLHHYMMGLVFLGGIVIFCIAMRWDMSDLKRVSRKSDVAFWLHLSAAPLIVHPVFTNLGIFQGYQSANSIVIVLILYLVLTVISLIIDRRAFMVSALIYVLVALTKLLKTYGVAGDSFAYVGVLIGFSLLLLSGFWHRVRRQLILRLPAFIRGRVPVIE